MKKIRKNSGLSLVEVIIASAIMLMVIVATDVAYKTYVLYAFSTEKDIQAQYLGEENLEVITFLRDNGWTNNIASLTPGTTYYLYCTSSYFGFLYWFATTTPQYVDGQFLRSFTVANVSRDANGNITAGGGTNDPNTKKITSMVSYYEGHATTTQAISTYITNINSN